MDLNNEEIAANRENAGHMLAQKIVRTRFADGVVVGITPGGLSVASGIADRLNLPLEMMSARFIKDPSNSEKVIGAVNSNELYCHDCPHSMPQDYLYFQMLEQRNQIRYDGEFYYGHMKEHDLARKTVIVVDDMLTSPDKVMVSLTSIRKHRPAKLIVAVPFVQAEAARIVQSACDEFVFIKMKQKINSPAECYKDFSPVDDWSARRALWQSTAELVEAV